MIHRLEWVARAIAFLALTTIALRDALLCGEQTVELTVAVVVVAFAYLALAFRLRMGQLATVAAASPVPERPGGHPYRTNARESSHRPDR